MEKEDITMEGYSVLAIHVYSPYSDSPVCILIIWNFISMWSHDITGWNCPRRWIEAYCIPQWYSQGHQCRWENSHCTLLQWWHQADQTRPDSGTQMISQIICTVYEYTLILHSIYRCIIMRTPKRLTQPTQMDLKLSTSQSNDLLLSVIWWWRVLESILGYPSLVPRPLPDFIL